LSLVDQVGVGERLPDVFFFVPDQRHRDALRRHPHRFDTLSPSEGGPGIAERFAQHARRSRVGIVCARASRYRWEVRLGDAQLICLLLSAALVAGCSDEVACENADEFAFILDGPEPASTHVTQSFRDSHLGELFEIDGLSGHGVGACCKGSWPAGAGECLNLSMLRRGANGDKLVHAVRALEEGLRRLQRADPVAARHDIPVSIQVDGLSAPRCTKGSACRPLEYEPRSGSMTPVPTGERKIILGTAAKGPACEHDGECVPGCEACEHWTTTGLACAGVGRPDLEKSFCGCVEKRCTLFF
jgi:hypothetical protein